MHFDVNTGELVDDTEETIFPKETVSPNEAVRKVPLTEERNPALEYGPEDEARAKLIEEQVKKVKKANKKNRPRNFGVSQKFKVVISIIAVIVIVGLASIFLLPTKTKLKLMAFATIKEDSLLGDLQTASIVNRNSSTVRINGDYYDQKNSDFDGSTMSYEEKIDKKKKRKTIEGSLQIGAYEAINLNLFMNQDKIIICIPTLTDYTMSYNYNSDSNNGILKNLMGQFRWNFSEDNINVYLFEEFYNTLYFKKTESKKLIIDGKNRKCKGYKAVLNASQVKKLLQKYSDLYDDQFKADNSKL